MRQVVTAALLLVLVIPVVAEDLEGLKIDGEKFSCSFSKDQEPIQGLLFKPAGKGPFPAVVVNHGANSSPQAFRKYAEVFAKNGYAVIAPELTHSNHKKGDGKSKTYAASKENADRILAAVKILESLSYVDAKKLCMFGHSMGAFATIGTCTQTDKFKVAAISAGGLRNGDGLDTEVNVAKFTAPMLILHGTADTIVRVELAKNLKAALDKHQKMSELKLFEGVGHRLPHEKIEEVSALVVAFFEKHLPK